MVLCNFTEKEVSIPAEVTEQIPADAKLLIGNYSKQKEEMLQAYEARVYAYHYKFRKEKASQAGVNGWEKQIDLYDFRA